MVLSLKSSPPSPPRSDSVWDIQMFNMETFSYDVSANDLGDLWGDSDFGDQVNNTISVLNFNFNRKSFTILKIGCVQLRKVGFKKVALQPLGPHNLPTL